MALHECTKCGKQRCIRDLPRKFTAADEWYMSTKCVSGYRAAWTEVTKGELEKMKTITFEPIGDRLVVVRDEKETTTPGGIVLTEQSAEKPQCGTVVAVGPGLPRRDGGRTPMQATEGARVLFSPYAETVTLQDVEYVLVKESDLYAILHD